jgi:hypothetical protein
MMQNMLTAAGFRDVHMQEIPGKAESESVDFYWNTMLDLAAPIVSAMSRADEPTRQKIKQEVFEIVRDRYAPKDGFEMESLAYLLTATK